MMIEVYEALELYQKRIAKSRLDDWPEVWAAHYSGDKLLGELGGQFNDRGEAESMYFSFVPFAFSVEVLTSFVFFEAHQAPAPGQGFINSDLVLYATRLHWNGEGVDVDHWIIPYTIKDGGVRLYDAPYKSPLVVPKVNECTYLLSERRMTETGIYSFEEAVAAAVRGDDIGSSDV